MTNKEYKDIWKLIRKFDKERFKLDKWNEKNRDRCGNSLTPNALGDEGWHQLFLNSGRSSALRDASNLLVKFLKENEK